MSTVSHGIGLLGAALLLAHLAASFTLPMRRSRRFNAAWLAGCMLLTLIPFGEVSAAGQVWSSVGYLSIPTLALLLHRTVRITRGITVLSRARLIQLHAGIAAFSLWFFPLAGGIGFYDPWSLGLQPVSLLAVLTVLGLAGLRAGLYWHVGVLAVAVLAWQVRLFESANLWTYLCDPFLGFAAVFYSLFALTRFALARRRVRTATREVPPEPVVDSSP